MSQSFPPTHSEQPLSPDFIGWIILPIRVTGETGESLTFYAILFYDQGVVLRVQHTTHGSPELEPKAQN